MIARGAFARGLRLTIVLAFAVGTKLMAVQASLPVYEREVFTYSALGRRDPFQPLDVGEQEGPRFADLTLSGVLYNPEIGSVATLTDRRTGRRYRAREGDLLGEAQVERILQDGVDFVIANFGVRRRETLWVRRERREGREGG
ncbi:hypothetical protein [Candidatus Palauibacter sp.]|uniref:hypothetical protein n=1 Tax=Candidatus Palauibacter sp. TaxID=3101350 RepID=UPI003C701679